MRLTANIEQQNSELKRLMIYESEEGVYLFGYNTQKDSSCLWDVWYESLDEVMEVCIEEYGIQKDSWSSIPEPLENCQHDWIAPVRIKGKDKGQPEWGKFEELIDGEWVEIKP